MRTICFVVVFSLMLIVSLTSLAATPSLRFERFTIADGLSQNSVNAVLQDQFGYIWVGTQGGLNRYDGYRFVSFLQDSQDPTSLSHNYINVIFQDSKQRLWIGTKGGGLDLYHPESETFSHFSHDSEDPNSLSHNEVQVIFEDRAANLWVGTFGGGLNRLDESSQNFVRYQHDADDDNSLSSNKIFDIAQDAEDNLWIATDAGLNRLDKSLRAFRHFSVGGDPTQLTSHVIKALSFDTFGRLWVGTDKGLYFFEPEAEAFAPLDGHHAENVVGFDDINEIFRDGYGVMWIGSEGGGLSYFDHKSQQFLHHTHQGDDPDSLSHNSVLAITEDEHGILWIGTYGGGLNKLDSQKRLFGHVKQKLGAKDQLAHSLIWSLLRDNDGVLWVGTENGVDGFLQTDTGTKHWRYQHQPDKPNSLSHNRILSIYQDSTGMLWFGSREGLNRFDKKTEVFTRFTAGEAPNHVSHGGISVMLEDDKGRFWLATEGGGVNVLDRDSLTFRHFRHQNKVADSLAHDTVYAIFQDAQSRIWFGSLNGLSLYQPETQNFRNFHHQPDNPNSIAGSIVTSIHQDRHGVLWLATYGGGLTRFDVEEEKFTRYSEKQGLVNNNIYAIVEDGAQGLWLSTNNGLSRFDLNTYSFDNYDVNDGLQSKEFNIGAYLKGDDGEIFFGGVNGFNRFYPDKIHEDKSKPRVVLTDFLVANQSVEIRPEQDGESKKYTLPKAIDQLEHITLTYEQNLISFEFAALHLTNPMKNQYAYMLEGQDDDWIKTDANKRWATYTNLSDGDYVLRVKASNHQGYWNKQGKSLKVTVLPPPWRSWWAYTIYLSLLLLVIISFLNVQRKKILYERKVNAQLKQVDRLKDEFLANTSHELRTPLNGIIGIAESLMDGVAGELPVEAKQNLAMVVASGKRLANLVNDILDFSKLKNSHLTLSTRPVDMYSMVDVVLTLSKPLLGGKSLKLINQVDKDLPAVIADENRLQQVLHNLVGNAIKFTDSGEVVVSAQVEDKRLVVAVSDTGIGIDASQFDAIFESFEQVDGDIQRQQSGTGLGLAVSQQLVALHGGKIEVESELGKGTTFKFALAVSNEQADVKGSMEPMVSRIHAMDYENVTKVPVQEGTSECRILLVDDEPINRRVLHNHLSLQNYELVEASSGQEALDAIEHNGPFDLVLLDIMMPKVSGYEVCENLRNRHSANDLPVIFLTAKNQVADLVQSFAVGANDYLSKPVNKHELLTRVETHLKFLDIHRNLEGKVEERTLELEQKNRQILETQQQMVHAEKMASLGTLTAGIAHEINNPNNFVHVSTQVLESDLIEVHKFFIELAGDEANEEILASFKSQFDPLYAHLTTIKDGSDRIKNIVQDLRTFTQTDATQMQDVLVNDLLVSTVNLVKAQYVKSINFDMLLDKPVALLCNPAQLNQVFMNLIVNACHAIEHKQKEIAASLSEGEVKEYQGTLTVSCATREQSVEIYIQDNGCGMTEETKVKLFEPFYTTKDVGEGTGLGLSISYGIIQKHNGEIVVNSELGEGTSFCIIVPNS